MGDTTLLGVRIDPKLHKKFKLACVREGLNMSDVIRQLIVRWLEESNGKEGKEN